MHWTRENPFDVGNAAAFKNGFTSLSLAPFMDKNALKCCTNREAAECAEYVKNNPSVSPGCLGRLLRTDYQLRTDAQVPAAQTVSPAMTIEGWVKINTAAGGVVLSTGRASDQACHNKGSCAVALIYIKVNATHVSVGHETAANEDGSTWALRTVDFAIDSSDALVQQLSDEGFYLGSEGPSLVGKFVHVMVVRKSLVGASHKRDLHSDNGGEYWFSTYKVYVNGYVPSHDAGRGLSLCCNPSLSLSLSPSPPPPPSSPLPRSPPPSLARSLPPSLPPPPPPSLSGHG